jgi:hypothetical protein
MTDAVPSAIVGGTGPGGLPDSGIQNQEKKT